MLRAPRWRGLVVAVGLAAAGCGRADAGHDGFTDDEWALVRTLSPLPDLDPCPGDAGVAAVADRCERMARLGQALFCTPGYSGPLAVASELGDAGVSGRVACVTCHDPQRFFADRPDHKVSRGADLTRRNTPTLVNAAYYRTFMWTSRFSSLTESFDLPLTAPAVLNSKVETLQAFLAGDTALSGEYDAVFGVAPGADERVEMHAGMAIEAYERRLVSRDAPFDRYVAGDEGAISAAAQRGLELFLGDGLCIECHKGPAFADGRVRVAAVPTDPGVTPDEGAFDNPAGHLGSGDDAYRGAFRTPSLRNVALTPPYMHRGQFATLHDVLAFYNVGPTPPVPANIDANLMPLALTPAQLDDLEEFLRTLTGAPVPPPWNACPP